MVVGRRGWRGAGGGRRRGDRDARARGAHAGRAGDRLGRAGAARAPGRRAHRLLLGDRRAALGRRRGERFQSHAQKRVPNLPSWRLSAVFAQYYITTVVYRASGR